MAFLKISQQGAKWRTLYNRLKSKGQHKWMDQIRQSVDNIKKQSDPIDVLSSFSPSKTETYIPIITRVERFHFKKMKKR